MKKKIKHLISTVLTKIMNPINVVMPKKKRIVLYSNLGFRDNVLSLYNFLIREQINEQFQIILVSNHFYQNMSNHENVKKVGPLIGIYYFLTSEYFFYCFGKYPIKPAGSQIIINLGHGMPIKKIGNSENKNKNIDYNYFNYVLSYSSFFDSIIEESFSAMPNQIMHNGAPRNDELFEYKRNEMKNIVWMPTYQENRQGSILDPFYTETDLRDLNHLLKQKKCILYIKLHPLEKDALDIENSLNNIKVIDDEGILSKFDSLYTFLAETNGLITDFSSVSIDYLLTDNPIAYVFNDEDSFALERGFNFSSLSEITAGGIIHTMNDFYNFISVVCGDTDDTFKVKRDLLKRTFFEYPDNHSSERLLRRVGIIK